MQQELAPSIRTLANGIRLANLIRDMNLSVALPTGEPLGEMNTGQFAYGVVRVVQSEDALTRRFYSRGSEELIGLVRLEDDAVQIDVFDTGFDNDEEHDQNKKNWELFMAMSDGLIAAFNTGVEVSVYNAPPHFVDAVGTD